MKFVPWIRDSLVQPLFSVMRRVAQYIETLPNGVFYRALEERGGDARLDNTSSVHCPGGKFFGGLWRTADVTASVK